MSLDTHPGYEFCSDPIFSHFFGPDENFQQIFAV